MAFGYRLLISGGPSACRFPARQRHVKQTNSHEPDRTDLIVLASNTGRLDTHEPSSRRAPMRSGLSQWPQLYLARSHPAVLLIPRRARSGDDARQTDEASVSRAGEAVTHN